MGCSAPHQGPLTSCLPASLLLSLVIPEAPLSGLFPQTGLPMRSAMPSVTPVHQTLVQEYGDMGGPDPGAEPVCLWTPEVLPVVWDKTSWWVESWPGSKGPEL